MALTLVIASSLSAALGSLCTGYLLKLIEHRRDAKDAAQLEVARQRAVVRFEAIRAVNGLARELHHSVSRFVWEKGRVQLYHLRMEDEHNFYREQIERISRDLRHTVRAEFEVLGEPYVVGAHHLTDAALKIKEDTHLKEGGWLKYDPYFVPQIFEDEWLSFLALSFEMPLRKGAGDRVEANRRRRKERQEPQQVNNSQQIALPLENKLRMPER